MDPERTPLAGSSESIETPHVGGDPEGERAEIAEAVYVEDEVPTPPAEQMRELLPALEPERRVTDWSRSERVEAALDRTLVEFFYRYWLRCEVEGIENVRAVANPLAAMRERASNATGGVSASERERGTRAE
jgi:hypothetical protein